MKNYIEEFIKDNGLKIDEEFEIEDHFVNKMIYKFNHNYELVGKRLSNNLEFFNAVNSILLIRILIGEYKVTVRLRPCPFCGSEAAATINSEGCIVTCTNNDCKAAILYEEYRNETTQSIEKSATAAWNKRV